jgi:hypothetical protein
VTAAPERATVLALPMDDPEASARSPALAALLADGWQVLAALPAARGDRTELLLLLAPPRPAQPPLQPRLLAVACAAGCLLGGLATTILSLL